MPISRLLYTSSARLEPGPQTIDKQLCRLAGEAALLNEEAGITGVLVYVEEQFIQVLEGAEADVVSLYEIIVTDPRHTEVEKVSRRIVGERGFGEWRMGHLPRGLVINAGRDALRVSRTPGAGWDDTEVDAILTEFRRALVSSSGV